MLNMSNVSDEWGVFLRQKKNTKVLNGAKKGASVFAGKHEMTCRISFYIAKQNDVLSYRN